MAWHTYGNKGYPTYSNVPAQEGGYSVGPKQPGNWYVVETTTVERIHTPAARYINFGDQEYNHGPSTLISPKYTPKDHHEGYEPNYGSDNENLSPPRYHGRESLMDKFRNKVNLKKSQPVKTGNPSSPNKYQSTNPVHDYPSHEAHPIQTRNWSGPNKHQPTSPEHSYPPEKAHIISTKNKSGPNKYKFSSPERSYPSEEAHLIITKSVPGPNKYQPTSPMHNHPTKETHLTRTKNLPGQKNRWMSAGPPMTHHPLTTVTNDINEALSFLEESINYSPHPGRSRTEEFDNFSPHQQPIEPNYGINTIDSQEAIRKYQGTRVPYVRSPKNQSFEY